MKNNFFILILLLIASACKQSHQISIKGTIKNADGIKVRLEDITAVPLVVVDTTSIHNNLFTINTTIRTKGLYRLVFDNSKSIFLFLQPSDELKLNLNYKNFNKYTVGNSAINNSIAQLIANLEKISVNIDTLRNQQQQFKKNTLIDSIQQLIVHQEKNYITTIKSFIQTTKEPELAAFGLNFFGDFFQEEIPFSISIIDSLNTITPKSNYIKEWHKALAIYKSNILKEQQAGLAIGSKAPNILLSNWNRDTFELKQLQGNYILLDFWASWCAPCRAENKYVVAAFKKYNKYGFSLYSVSLDTEVTAWRKAIETDQLKWNYHVSELKGWESDIVKLYRIEAIPTNYLLDTKGKIIAKNLKGKELEEQLSVIYAKQIAKDSMVANK